jgi:ligand-binding sensor domain-containing protein/signal transduction histidine kinase
MKRSLRGVARSSAACAGAALLLSALSLLSPPVLAVQLAVRTFSVADGLGSSFVSDITQDAAGYVWFATRDGLSWWNGYEMRTLTEAGGIANPAIERIYQARSGEYFAIGIDGSLYSHLPSSPDGSAGTGRVVFRRRSVRFEGQEVAFRGIYEDRHGVLWGAGRGVLVKGLGTSNTLIPLNRIAPFPNLDVAVRSLVEDGGGSLWMGTNVGLLRRLPGGDIVHYAIAPRAAGDGVNALALDRAGRLWIGHSWSGVVVLDPSPPATGHASQPLRPTAAGRSRILMPAREGDAVVLTTADGLPDDDVLSLLGASDGQVWVGTGSGLARFDGTSFTRYTTKNGLSDNVIHALCEDGGGRLWIATPTGANRIVVEGFAGYTVGDGLPADRVLAIGEAPGGIVQTVGMGWTVGTFDGRSFHPSRLPISAGRSLMWASQAAYRDREGGWWALTNDGLYRFSSSPAEGPGAFTPVHVYTTADGLPSSHIFRLFEDRSGIFWVGTRSGDPIDSGLARFDPGVRRATKFGPAEGLPEHWAPSAFAEDRQGSLWIGFYDGGLARYREGRFRAYTPAEGIPPGMVTALLVDRQGRLWLSTNLAGLARMDDPAADPPKLTRYSTRNGLGSNNVRTLVEDGLGRIYAGTARGVDRLDPATGRIRRYGREDGLATDFVTASLRDSHGDLWFGTYGGAYRLQPTRDRPEEAPAIAITGLRIDGEARPVRELGQAALEDFELDAGQRDVAIDFVSVSRHRAQGITYQYSLDPDRFSWSEPSVNRGVHFARLAPGRYRFAVRAVTAGGMASAAPATVAFVILPPIWQRWWAIALVAAAMAATGVGLYKYRVRRLLEIQRLRMAIASDLHDEVATNLGSIAMFSALVRQQASSPSPFLDRISSLAADSVEALREIIWSIDPKPETIGSLLVRLRDTMVATARAHGIHLVVGAVPDGMRQNLTPDQRKNLRLMLKEAVANAITHSGGTEVTVTAEQAGRQVRMVVRDNGTGALPGESSSGRGLATMRARAEAMGGTATITRVPGAGTRVEFLVKIEK